MNDLSHKSAAELLRDYWAAQAEFGPFEVGPEEYLRKRREEAPSQIGDGSVK